MIDLPEHQSPSNDDDATFAFDISSMTGRIFSAPEPGRDIDFGIGYRAKTSQDPLRNQSPNSSWRVQKAVNRQVKTLKISRYGIPYPSLPARIVKRFAGPFAQMPRSSRPMINKESLVAIMQASEYFFEQLGDDIGTYAKHAGRKTVDNADVVALMRR